VWFAGARVLVRVQAAQSDGRLGAWESEESLGDALPLHIHTREDEQVMLLEGAITVRVGDRVHHLVAGDSLALPRGVPHAHVVTSPRARLLTVAMPGGFERLFTDLGAPALPGTAAPPADTGALAEAAARFGVQIVGPPPAVV
jgi:mannose-6-phosphate isomerase-like protein (cupin superfamily)